MKLVIFCKGKKRPIGYVTPGGFVKTAKGWRKVSSKKRKTVISDKAKDVVGNGRTAEQKNEERVKAIRSDYDSRIDAAKDRVEATKKSLLKQQAQKRSSGLRTYSIYTSTLYKRAQQFVEKLQREKQRKLKGAGAISQLLKDKLKLASSTSSSSAVRGYRHHTKGFNVIMRGGEVVVDFTYISEEKIAEAKTVLEENGYTIDEAAGTISDLVIGSYNPFVAKRDIKE